MPSIRTLRIPRLTVALAVLWTGCLDVGGPDDDSEGATPIPPAAGRIYTATIATVDGPREVTYELIDGKAVTEGDIVLPGLHGKGADDEALKSYAVGQRWSDGRVPYEIDPALTNPDRVHVAIEIYRQTTTIRLVPRNGERNFVRFVPSNRCRSELGRKGGRQEIELSPDCSVGNTMHEIGHTLGLGHEQSRNDRDSHVTIHWDNIDPDKVGNFKKHALSQDLGEYDFGSLMHYDSMAYSTNGRPTITRKDGSLIRSNTLTLSDGDLLGLARMYPRPGAYLAGDWDGDGISNVGVRVGNRVVMDTDGDSAADMEQWYGGGNREKYLVGDWDGDGRDNLAVRASNEIFMDVNFDGAHDLYQMYGDGSGEYLVGDWDGDGRDNLAVRWGNEVYMDVNFDGAHDLYQAYGLVNLVDQYLVGDWDGDGRDNLAVRWGTAVLKDFNFDGYYDVLQIFGS